MCDNKKEELDWLDVSLHFLFTSTEISKCIEDETGAKIHIQNKRFYVEGNTEEREKAKDIILAKVYDRNVDIENGSHNRARHKTLRERNDDGCWEAVDFLDPKYFGELIGKNGVHIKKLEETFGLQMRKDERKNKIVMKGDEKSKNEAIIWFQDFVATKEFEEGKPDVRKRFNQDDSSWEAVDFLDSKYFGKIIGKGGQHIKELQRKFNVEMRKDELRNKIVMRGEKEAKETAMQYFRDFVAGAESERTSDPFVRNNVSGEGPRRLNISEVNGEEEVIDFVAETFFGSIIGKCGANIRSLERKYQVSLRIDGSINKLLVKGQEDNKSKLKSYLRNYVSRPKEYTKISQLREVFFVGMESEDRINLDFAENCDKPSHTEICSFKNSLPLEKCYENVPKLRESLLNALCIAKMNIEGDQNAICEVKMHWGEMHYAAKPGSYSIGDLIENPNVAYEPIPAHLLSFEKIESQPIVDRLIRYDMLIELLHRRARIRYQMFLKEASPETPGSGSLKFVSCEEAGTSLKMFSTLRCGPGYFCNPETKVCRYDIVDPNTNRTTRVNIRTIKRSRSTDEFLKEHLNVLKEFFEDVYMTEENTKLFLPSLPTNYVITYLRRSERNTYRFSDGNELLSSTETVYINLDKQNTPTQLKDIYFRNDIVEGLLSTPDWTVEEVVDAMEKMLKFNDIMTQYLC